MMSEEIKKNEDVFIDIVEKTTEIISDKNYKFNENLSNLVEKETRFDYKKSKQTVDDISLTIDLIADNFDNLQNARKNGKTRTQWFQGKLDDTIHKYKIEKTGEFIGEIKDSLKDATSDIGKEIFGKNIDISKPLKNPMFKGLNKTAIVNDFQNEIKNNTLLGAIVFENSQIKIEQKHKEIKVVKDYFEAKLDSPLDLSFKKAIATATVIAQNKKILPKVILDKTPDEIAMIVDRGVTSAKIAYKLGKGELSPIDAVEYTIDRNVAVLNSAIVKTTTRYGGVVGGKVGAAIGSLFGPAGTVAGATIGAVVGKVAGCAVGKVITTGVKKVASAVKSAVKSTWEGTKNIASSCWDVVCSWF